MNGYVFQGSSKGAERKQFTQTVDELIMYAGTQLKPHGRDIQKLLQEMKEVDLPKPINVDPNTSTKTAYRIWEKEVDAFVKRKSTYVNNKGAIFTVALGQCSNAIRAKIDLVKTIEQITETNNILTLLKEIKGVIHKFESQKYLALALDDAYKNLYSFRQTDGMAISAHLKSMRTLFDVLDHYDRNFGEDKALVNAEFHAIHNLATPLSTLTTPRSIKTSSRPRLP